MGALLLGVALASAVLGRGAAADPRSHLLASTAVPPTTHAPPRPPTPPAPPTIQLAIDRVRPASAHDEPQLFAPPTPVLIGGAAAFLQGLLEIERIPLGRVELGRTSARLRLDGAILVAQDFPSLGSRARLRILNREVLVVLPALQVVPRMEGGLMFVEVKLLLVDRRF